MRDRSLLGALLILGLMIPLTSCNDSPSLTSISVTPTTVTFGGAGLHSQLTAIGSYTHPNHAPTTVDITDQVTWTSSSTDCVTVNSTGLITSGINNCSDILVSATAPGFHGVITGSMTVNVNQPSSGGGGAGSSDITSINIIPATATVSTLNQTTQFIAIGSTAGGVSVDLTNFVTWTSSNASVASITASGLATAFQSGSTTISAVFQNTDGTAGSGTAVFTVAPSSSPEPLVSLAVVPTSQTALAINQTAQFIAIGTTASGTTVNLTSQPVTINGQTISAASWTSSNVKIGTINSTGLATAVSAGTTAITAIATNPDGTIVEGSASFTVTVPGVSEPLVSLAIVPTSQTSLAIGQTAQFIAIGTTGSGATVNLTNQTATVDGATIAAAKWNSSAMQVATIDQTTGIATALSAGTTAITAIATNPDGTVVTGTATYTVAPATITEPIVSLEIIPNSQSASSVNQTAQYIAIGTTSAGTTVDLTNQSADISGVTIAPATWSSSEPTVASVDPATGIATALTSGATAITAIVKNPDGTVVTASASFTVNITATQEPLLSLTIIPDAQSVHTANESAQFLAIGTFSGAASTTTSFCGSTGTTQDCTDYVTWLSSDTKVATINSTGLATALNTKGTTAITAMAKNPDGTLVTGAAAFNQVLDSSGTIQQATLTVTPMGSNATNGQITGAVGTSSNTIQCGNGYSTQLCSNTYPLNTTVTLTATPVNGATFGGWSSNCTPTAPINPTGPNSCTIDLTDNQTVAAIFY
jgi:hypothetical protein